MKVMMIFDQTQAGLGGKESPDLPMGGKPMAIVHVECLNVSWIKMTEK